MGADFLPELIQSYFDETPQLMSRLKLSLEKNDHDGFRQAAHSIKSTSNSLGALQLGEQARELEMMGRSGDLNGASEKVTSLTTGFDAVRKALEELLNG
jgi:HPt (histidine-containing phosphotransfer) domain-containing protein